MSNKYKVTYRVKLGDEFKYKTFVTEMVDHWKLSSRMNGLFSDVLNDNEYKNADELEILEVSKIEE